MKMQIRGNEAVAIVLAVLVVASSSVGVIAIGTPDGQAALTNDHFADVSLTEQLSNNSTTTFHVENTSNVSQLTVEAIGDVNESWDNESQTSLRGSQSVHRSQSSLSAAVTLQGGANVAGGNLQINDTFKLAEGFEDNDTAEYGGNTASFTTQSTTVYNGTYALEATSTGAGRKIITDTGVNYSAGTNLSTRWNASGSSSTGWPILFGVQSEVGSGSLSGYEVSVDVDNNKWGVYRRDNGVQATNPVAEATGLTFPTGEFMKIEVAWQDDGTMVATIYNATGSQLSQVQGTDTNYTSGGIGFGEYDGTQFFDEVTTGSGSPNGTYISAIHPVANSNTGFVNVTSLNNGTATVTWERDTGSGWSTLNTTDISTPANHTFTWTTVTGDLRVNVTYNNTAGNPTFVVADEGAIGSANSVATAPGGNAAPGGPGATGDPVVEVTASADAAGNAPKNVALTADTGETVTFGDLSAGETATKELNLSADASSLDWTFSGGTLDYTLQMKERTETENVTVKINGHETTYTGRLTDGEATELTAKTDWLVDGTNQVNVTVAPNLGADAPAAAVDLNIHVEEGFPTSLFVALGPTSSDVESSAEGVTDRARLKGGEWMIKAFAIADRSLFWAASRISFFAADNPAEDDAMAAQEKWEEHNPTFQSYINERHEVNEAITVVEVEFVRGESNHTLYWVGKANTTSDTFTSIEVVNTTNHTVDDRLVLEGFASANADDELQHLYLEQALPDAAPDGVYVTRACSLYEDDEVEGSLIDAYTNQSGVSCAG